MNKVSEYIELILTIDRGVCYCTKETSQIQNLWEALKHILHSL